MQTSRWWVWACFAPLLIGVTPRAEAGGRVQGRLYDHNAGWKELFPWGTRNGPGKMAGNFTDMGGFFHLPSLDAGVYTFGFSRRFGLGPVILPSVVVQDNKTTYLTLLKADAYDARGGGKKTENHRLYAQGFMSRGECVRSARLDVVVPKETELVYTVRDGKPDGKQIGPASDGAWQPGQVRLQRGKIYFLTVMRKDEQPFTAALSGETRDGEPAYADGRPIAEGAVGGKIVSDRTGIIVDSFPKEGKLFGPCQRSFGQTFVARGTGLAMVDFTPGVGGGRRAQTRYEVRVRENGPEGKPVGPVKVSVGNDTIVSAAQGYQLRLALWDRGEVQLVPGKKYFIEILGDNVGFQISTHEGALLDGEFYKDGQAVLGKCLDTVMIEYEPDNCPPPPVTRLDADLAGTSVQLSFDVPEDMDVSRAVVERSAEGRSDELGRFYVCPGRTEVFVDRATQPGNRYRYAVVLLDAAGNKSGPVLQRVEVKPLTPETNLLINGDFIARAQASGGLCPGWDTASLHGTASWSVASPKNERDFYTIGAWQKYENYDVYVYQKVPVTKGVEYRLAANSNRSDPFNNGQVNEVTLIGIDPLGGTNAGADSVVWSAPEYISKTWTAQSVRATAQSGNVTVFLRARANYGGLGMEGKFAKASLRVVSTTPAGGVQ